MLYLVATPIGNLEDITFRAVRILKEADLIAAEDTRHTRKLLTHFEITTRMVSYHDHNQLHSGSELIRLLLAGQTVALVSDAGTPAISDPGFGLVEEAIDNGIAVISIPGANAALSALIVSGLATDRFMFYGFLPRETKNLRQLLERLAEATETIIFYESPHRIVKTLMKMNEIWGIRKGVLAREITKRYEEIARGSLIELLAYVQENPPLGEYCIVVQGLIKQPSYIDAEQAWWKDMLFPEHIAYYEKEGLNRKEAIKKTALDRGVPKREIYNKLLDYK